MVDGRRLVRPGLAMIGPIALAALLSMWPAAARADVPTISRPVTDHAGVLTSTEIEMLSRVLVEHRDATGVQIAILTVSTTGGVPIEDYSLQVAEAWGGGGKQDQGVLLVLAVTDRRSRIEVGYGLEAQVTDAEARTILVGMRPFLVGGHYGAALTGAADELVQQTGGQALDLPEVPIPLYYEPIAEPASSSSDGCNGGIIFMVVIAVVIGVFSGLAGGGSSSGWGGSSSGSSWSSSSSSFSSSSSSFSSSSSSSSYSSSSYGGGGGSFGGGGASSSW